MGVVGLMKKSIVFENSRPEPSAAEQDLIEFDAGFDACSVRRSSKNPSAHTASMVGFGFRC